MIIGDKEIETKTVTVESRDEGDIGQMKIENLIEKLKKENREGANNKTTTI